MVPTEWRGHRDGAANTLASALLLMAGLASDAPSQISPPAGQHQEPFRISVNVDLVVLHATVRDRDGRLVSDLRERHFEVYEDGVRQAIRMFRHEDVPITAGLVVDHSGSMGPKLHHVVAAARAFVLSSNREDEMFVVNFNENVSLGLPDVIPFTNQPELLDLAISRTPADGQTALYDAIAVALERLQAGSRDKKVLIVISDGGDNASARKLAEVLPIARQSSALVYTLGIFDEEDPDRNPGVLRRLARATGGAAYFPGPGKALSAVCEQIARDIRNQYTIGYVSTNAARNGAYRAVRVTASAEGAGRLVVQTRAGYIAGGDARAGREPE